MLRHTPLTQADLLLGPDELPPALFAEPLGPVAQIAPQPDFGLGGGGRSYLGEDEGPIGGGGVGVGGGQPPVAAAPEPPAWILLLAGALIVAFSVRRRGAVTA